MTQKVMLRTELNENDLLLLMKLKQWLFITIVLVLLCAPLQALAMPAFPF